MEQSIQMSPEQFNDFCRSLSILKECCTDADIVEGKIRQRANDNSSIFELDLTSILDDVTMPISGLKQQLDLLKMFTDHEVTIDVKQPEAGENGWYSFSDPYSVLKFEMSDSDFMDNHFIPNEEMEKIFDLKEEDLILTADISNFISDRMRIVAGGFNITHVRVDLLEEASISAKTQAGDQTAKFVEGLVTDKVLDCETFMVITPFIIDHDDSITFKMYNIQPTISANVYTTAIKDIDIMIHTRSSLIEHE